MSGLTIRSAKIRGVRVPLRFTLGTSAAIVRAVPLILLDLYTEQGITGRTYLFCYTPSGARAIGNVVAEAVELVAGHTADPLDVAKFLSRRYALLGVTGTVRMALSAIDMALWDANARSFERPLSELLGAKSRPIRAYDSRGLGLMDVGKLPDEAAALLGSSGLHAVKLRLGYPSLAEDVGAIRALRKALPDSVTIMVDYNQALTRTEAILRGHAIESEGIAWIEEPIRHDDYKGNAAVAVALRVPLQIGENFNGPEALVEATKLSASDLVMPDAARIGGVTGWLQSAGIAASLGVEMSSHLLPEMSAHLLAATPTCHWLEYVDWANAFLDEPLQIVDGCVVPSTRPGSGLDWDEARLAGLETL